MDSNADTAATTLPNVSDRSPYYKGAEARRYSFGAVFLTINTRWSRASETSRRSKPNGQSARELIPGVFVLFFSVQICVVVACWLSPNQQSSYTEGTKCNIYSSIYIYYIFTDGFFPTIIHEFFFCGKNSWSQLKSFWLKSHQTKIKTTKQRKSRIWKLYEEKSKLLTAQQEMQSLEVKSL